MSLLLNIYDFLVQSAAKLRINLESGLLYGICVALSIDIAEKAKTDAMDAMEKALGE